MGAGVIILCASEEIIVNWVREDDFSNQRIPLNRLPTGRIVKLQFFGLLMRRADFIRKDPDAGKDSGQEEKGTTEDEMVGCHHRFIGYGFG